MKFLRGDGAEMDNRARLFFFYRWCLKRLPLLVWPANREKRGGPSQASQGKRERTSTEWMGGAREGRRGVLFAPSRDGVTPTTTGPEFCLATSYGATGASAAAIVHGKGATRRRRQRFHGEESGLLRRSLASVGVLALFAFAVTTANNKRFETETGQQLRAPLAETTLVRVSAYVCVPDVIMCLPFPDLAHSTLDFSWPCWLLFSARRFSCLPDSISGAL